MPRYLALEWDAREARVAVARTRGSDIVVEHAFAVDLGLRDGQTPAESEVGKRVAAALAARHLGRTETLVAVGRTSIELRQLALPPSPVEELPELVRFQALRQFTTINEEWPIDFVHVDAGESESLHVIAAAISPELVTQIQATCESAELTAKRLVLRPFAAASLLHRHDKNRQPPCTLMVDLLAEEADLTVMVDNQVAMMRTVRLSIGNGAEAQSRALLGEIRRTIAAAQNQLSGHRVERVVMCGDGSEQATLKALVEEQLTFTVELFDPFDDLQVENDLTANKPEHPGRFAPLLGMLVAEAAGAAHAIDFLHPREKPAPPNPWLSNSLYIGLAAAVCAALVLFLFVRIMSMDGEIAELKDNANGLEKNVEKATKKGDDVKRIEDFLSSDFAWLDEIRGLSDTLPPADDVILTQLNMIVAQGGGKMIVDGITRESSQIEDVQSALRISGRNVVTSGGQIDERRDEYKWTFMETVILKPRMELSANAIDTSVAAEPAGEPEIVEPAEEPEVSEPAEEPEISEPAEEPEVSESAAAPESEASSSETAPAAEPSVEAAPPPDAPVVAPAAEESPQQVTPVAEPVTQKTAPAVPAPASEPSAVPASQAGAPAIEPAAKPAGTAAPATSPPGATPSVPAPQNQPTTNAPPASTSP